MRKLTRGIAAGALSAPLVLGLSGMAGAAEYTEHETSVGQEGVSTSQTQVQAPDDGSGKASYQQHEATAGEDGAQVSGTSSQAGGQGGLLDFLGL